MQFHGNAQHALPLLADQVMIATPPIELDHIFVCVVAGGVPEAARLKAFGLTEGSANSHPGQGTACRRFFFQNAYIELLWVNDSTEAKSELTRPTRLWERWTERSDHASPFGFGFRPHTKHTGAPPFSFWEYRPLYLPRPLGIQVAKNSDIVSEPMIFHLPFAQRPDAHVVGKRQPMGHPAGLQQITSVDLVTPLAGRVSPELRTLLDAGLLRLREGANDFVELGFDGYSQGKRVDFRPLLPMTFNW